MQLSEKAKSDLRKILIQEIGEKANSFSDKELNDFGVRLLKLTALSLKRKLSKTYHQGS